MLLSNGLRGRAWRLLTCWSTTFECLHTVVQTNGVGGLYQGMRAKMLQSVLASALLFLGYEKIVEVVAKVIGGYEGCHAGGGARGKIPDGIARGGEGLCTAPPSPPPPSSR
ncbi:unnamed protein product [Discosporangium mesarthrocarpum]